MFAGPRKVSFIVTHINEVDNMRLDRRWRTENGKGQGRACRSEGEAVDGLGETLISKSPTREMVVFCSYGQA
jgi:hypothetical protein